MSSGIKIDWFIDWLIDYIKEHCWDAEWDLLFQENFKNMVELSAQLRESYAAKLKFEIENLDVKTRQDLIILFFLNYSFFHDFSFFSTDHNALKLSRELPLST